MIHRAVFQTEAASPALPRLRHRVEDQLRAWKLSPQVVERSGMLVSELLHNAVEAASGGPVVRVFLQLREQGLEIAVERPGNRDFASLLAALRAPRLPGPEAERGRGLWLVRHYSRAFHLERAPDGTVRMVLLSRMGGGGS